MTYCDRCERGFNSLTALWHHKADSPKHHIYADCQVDFASWVGLEQHWIQSSKHADCRLCHTHFDDEEDFDDHYDEEHYICKVMLINYLGARRFSMNITARSIGTASTAVASFKIKTISTHTSALPSINPKMSFAAALLE
ncbi:hypothetical protein M422DRAFT_274054 [Sphaerobolus stellatus SS14]|uniref:Unplaced genomic scaffold SPHSTscaffold_363, whole genome shotgun sequence n=1 Tax=Sphaerobolus stellatus (strain SS14) TaxID=990650 RepID=A0A0C9TT64_SPHS4|nr:hypothetical protein M422DRAFT_274054 [Sphaerobolus stellatus SS14]